MFKNKNIAKYLFLAFLSLFVISCAIDPSVEEPVAIVDSNQVTEDAPEDSIFPVPFETITSKLNDEQKEAFINTYGEGPFVVAPVSFIKEGAKYVPITVEKGPDGASTVFDSILTGVATIFPQYAWAAPLIGLFFKRPRKHLKNAAKKAIPHPGDTKIDLAGAVVDVAKAFGLVHSSPTTEKEFESEEKAKLAGVKGGEVA